MSLTSGEAIRDDYVSNIAFASNKHLMYVCTYISAYITFAHSRVLREKYPIV